VKYRRILRAALGSAWALEPSKLEAVVAFLELKARGAKLAPDAIRNRLGRAHAAVPTAPPPASVEKAVAVIPVVGIIAQRVSALEEISGPGGVSTARVARDFRAALADPNVTAIVLDIDSPGGTVYGVAELASEILAARGRKPIVAVANSVAASAAYWIASAADELVVTPGGEVGSIGVYSIHTDHAAWLESEGLKVTLVSAGRYKVEGNPYEPLGDEARAAIQGRVDDYYRLFARAVAKGRGTTPAAVRDGFGQGRVVGADEAVRLGMADRVATLDQEIARVTKPRRQRGAMAAETLNETPPLAAPEPDPSFELARRRQAMLDCGLWRRE